MSEMVDRVAKAIYEASPFKMTEGPYDRQSDLYKRNCRLLARAAINAMREVDNEVLEAMWHAMFVGEFTAHELPMLGAGWEAAIDAALSEVVG